MNLNTDVKFDDSIEAKDRMGMNLKLRSFYHFEARDKDGKLLWVEDVENLVTTEGKNDLLTNYFKGSAYTAAWFIGLVDNASFTAYAAGDTAAQINGTNGWHENTSYSQATRPSWTGGSASGGSIDDTGSPAAFSITATITIRGAFLASNSTKAGTAGKLYGEADFASSRTLNNGDTLNVTVTLTVS